MVSEEKVGRCISKITHFNIFGNPFSYESFVGLWRAFQNARVSILEDQLRDGSIVTNRFLAGD